MPENQQASLAEWLEAKRKSQEKLTGIALSEEDYYELYTLLEVVTGADLEEIRGQQFSEDARELAVLIKAATDKNTRLIAPFLRKFAVHVARRLLSDQEQVEALVDTLPAMTSLDF